MNSQCSLEITSNMSSEIEKISSEHWDISGRPKSAMSYFFAMSDLLNLCDTIDDFKGKYFQLFPETDQNDHQTQQQLILMWHCYVSGITRASNHLSRKNASISTNPN